MKSDIKQFDKYSKKDKLLQTRGLFCEQNPVSNSGGLQDLKSSE